MTDAIQAGRVVAAAMMRATTMAAMESGDPRSFWLGFLGMTSGVAAAQIGIEISIDIFQSLADNARKHLECGHIPVTHLDYGADGEFKGIRQVKP